jgi:hypothetical protein
MEESIFSQEWRRCLREHYKHVVRAEDKITEASLTKVLRSQAINFSEEELRQLYVEATMRDMPDEFVPDMEKATEPGEAIVTSDPDSEKSFVAHPAECTCAACMESTINEDLHDEDGQPLSPDVLEERKEEQEKQAGDSAKQMSMF